MEYVFDNLNFEQEVLKSDKPVLVDMFATWCGPCRMMSPVIADAAREYDGRIKVGKVDIDQSGELADKYGITAVPTLLLFKNGAVVKELVGYQSKDALCGELDKLIE